MDIDIPLTPIDEPVFHIDEQVLISIASAAAAAEGLEKAGSADSKKLLNRLFSEATSYLHNALHQRDPASWILEAYKQLQMWTLVYRADMEPTHDYEAPKELAPIGRYGWRYVIDYLLPKTANQRIVLTRPDVFEVSRAFTALAVAVYTSELSNLIHHFPDVYSDVEVDLSNPLEAPFPKFSERTLAVQKQRHSYLNKIDWSTWEKYPSLNPGLSDQKIRSLLNDGLEEGMGFSLGDLGKLRDALQTEFLASGLIVIQSFDYVTDWMADCSAVPRDRVSKALDFMLLSMNSKSKSRAFLDKNEPVRMLNFAGVKLPQLPDPSSIYAAGAARKSHIWGAKSHVIMSLFTLAEWMDNFQDQCSNGQRPDLKSNARLNSALKSIEQYQRRSIFESGVVQIFSKHGFAHLASLKKWPSSDGNFVQLPCGEIDVLAYHPERDLLIIAECKANAPATDARAYSQQYRDHFKQKAYHDKFLRKIRWLQDPATDLRHLTKLNKDFTTTEKTQIIPLFVTKYPSIARFYCDEYRVLTFAELDEKVDQFSGRLVPTAGRRDFMD